MKTSQIKVPVQMRDSLALPNLLKWQSPAWLPVIGSLLVMAFVILLVLFQMIPPAVVSRSASLTDFSAERALDHLQLIARAPHPTGSLESLQVRNYLFTQLQQLGLEAKIQTTMSIYHDTGKWGIPGPKGMEVGPDTWGLAGATVHNVMARIPGSDSSGAVMLAAHYDSTAYGPGASDDGVGVAAILETARAILAGPQLRNDIILLFTDGEEVGLLGAQAFAENHPWMKDVALVLNLEARGSGGTVLMYETSQDNAWVIQEYARAAVAPLTGSVATDVWRLMPNSSDLTVFLQNGKQGMNFAYGENWTAYHTTQDSVENMDPGSLQHHGANALALAAHFASLDLTTPSSEDAIFFSVLRLGVIRYPKGWALPLTIAVLLAYLLVIAFGLRSNHLTLRRIGLGTAAFLCASAAAVIFGFLGVKALYLLKSGGLIAGMGGTYNAHWYELGFLLVFLPITASIYAVYQRMNSPANLAMGALFFWLFLTIASTFLLAGASYMFLWPLMTGLLVLSAYLWVNKSGNALIFIVLLLPVIVGVVLVGTVLYLVQLMFGLGILPAGGFLTVLVLSLAFPYLEFKHLPRLSAWGIVPAVLGVLIIGATALVTRPQIEQPRLNFIFYSMNADSGQAGWVAEAQLPDPTLAHLLGQTPREGLLSDYFPTSMHKSVWVQDAAPTDSIPPEMRVLQESTNGSQRTLRLNFRSPRGASAIMAEVVAKDAILNAALFGEQYSRGEPRSSVFFKVIGPPDSGVEVALTLREGVPVTIKLADVSPGLPLTADQRTEIESGMRSGYGGGHGIDSMTLIQREFLIP